MSEVRIQLLAYIVAQSLPHISPSNPHGYCFIPGAQESGARELSASGHIEAMFDKRNPEGEIPVRPTAFGVSEVQGRGTAVQEVQQQPAHAVTQPIAQPAAPQPVTHAPIRIETGIPLPPAGRRGGFQPGEGGTKIDRYKFNEMPIGGSFFVPQSESTKADTPVHRTFSSVVSQANNKLHPKAFEIRAVDETAQGNGVGARVWRVADMTGPRPMRKKRETAIAPQPAQPQYGQAPQPGFAGGFVGGFAQPVQEAPQGGFPSAGQFGGFGVAPAPLAPAPGFGGGFPENSFGGEAPAFTGGFDTGVE